MQYFVSVYVITVFYLSYLREAIIWNDKNDLLLSSNSQ